MTAKPWQARRHVQREAPKAAAREAAPGAAHRVLHRVKDVAADDVTALLLERKPLLPRLCICHQPLEPLGREPRALAAPLRAEGVAKGLRGQQVGALDLAADLGRGRMSTWGLTKLQDSLA
jgi:hypothetical protein